MMAWFSEKAFERSGVLIGRASRTSDAAFGPLVKRLTPIDDPEKLDWAGDADWARLQQDPLRARLAACGGHRVAAADRLGRICAD
jgi:adhesin transport system membrane fusion protein